MRWIVVIDILYILYVLGLKLITSLRDSFLAVSPVSVSQPATSLSSSPPSVQPVTIQAQLQGLTTTSPLLATTAGQPAQTITSHVQQVPVSVFSWHMN